MRLTWTTAVKHIDWLGEQQKFINRSFRPQGEAQMSFDTENIRDFIAQWRNPIIFGVVVAVVLVIMING